MDVQREVVSGVFDVPHHQEKLPHVKCIFKSKVVEPLFRVDDNNYPLL
jgi:hypothetical protein